MSSHWYHVTLLLFLIISVAGKSSPEHHDLVEKSCVHASYPNLCLRTLSTNGGASATTPRELAQVAVRVSLAHVRRASDFLSDLKAGGRRERSALTDCVEQMADSVDDLSQTLAALRRLRRGADFHWQMSNAETWVSAALTNEDTCLDGFREIDGKVRSDVHRKINNVARVTSNALYLINLLDQ
ncbi:Plant invertase/pectin methylesterase inhibitor superfamily protein [Striga hermonthica]|uniref:Plant invertase/pectin methylesterase inhibitor superfamily protein n=1 Tax=Striga hermonthica TaxID=68872 RepID=A0A9N7RAV7_STRHE|nr:Plant invertase/pectin methylesterase inhibitor superfamily protein [Striga hermonthica]